ncbi:putative transporter [subsurface metagenome]|jgi:Na+/H+ antiporter NhaD/arsenite permease-like protein
MYEIASIIISAVLFIAIMAIFTNERIDYISFTILSAVIACIVAAITFGVGFTEFITFIEFEPLFFIICMQIIIAIMEEQKIFRWVVLKTIHWTKADHRKFFFLICIMACITSAFVSDITVGIIFVPLVIRACKILKINPAPYLFGLSFTINIGSIYTPFSSSENILIANAFSLNFAYFIANFSLIVIPTLIYTLFLVDFTMLRKQDPPPEDYKKILLDIMDPNMIIVNKKKFVFISINFMCIVIGLIIIPEAYIVAVVGAVIMCLINRKKFAEVLLKTDLKVITFFIGIFLLMGTMQINGTFIIIGDLIETFISDNDLIAAITVLLMISVLSGFLAQIPTALVFISLMENIYGIGQVPNLIIMAIILGINIGSNFLPQGAACDLITLNLAEKNGVSDFNYKSLLKYGSVITSIHIGVSIIYLTLFSLLIP